MDTEDTEPIGEEEEDADVVIDEVEEEDPQHQPQTDERGVPRKNLYAEMKRKLKAMDKRYDEQRRRDFAEKDGEIRNLQARIRDLETRKTAPEEEYSKDDLYKGLAAARQQGDIESEMEIHKRILGSHEKELEEKQQKHTKDSANRAEYDRKAVVAYKQLLDSESDFYHAVAGEIDRRLLKNPTYGPSIVLDAAHAVAFDRPNLVDGGNKVPSMNPSRRGGFSESGSGKPVTKTKSGDVQIDEAIFKRFKQEYPQMSRESILNRMRGLKGRSNWSLGEGI
ncbi:MAG: hypothetical protein ACXABY_33815 [Candidatus Thorarchaeota archaeon]|jgi:hypothetical protein